jgi:hypothetical protein
VLERFRRRQRLRYWALALPILILAVALPMLRPLRHPRPDDISAQEALHLATIQALVSRGEFVLAPENLPSPESFGKLPGMIRVGDHHYAAIEPVLALLGAGIVKLLDLLNIDSAGTASPGVIALTLLLATLPVAGTATLLYRAGRLLELPRWRRLLLAAVAVTASGLLPYATVLSPIPAASLCLTASVLCIAHAMVIRPPPAGIAWTALAGLLAGLSAALHPPALLAGGCLCLGQLALGWKLRHRFAAVALFSLAAVLPLAAHSVLIRNLGLGWSATYELAHFTFPAPEPEQPGDEPATAPSAFAAVAWQLASRAGDSLFGHNGLLSNCPAALLALAGVGLLLTRHWPRSTRALAVACALAALTPLLVPLVLRQVPMPRAFGPTPLIPLLPPLLLWAGLLLRSRFPSPAHSNLYLLTLGYGLTVFSLATAMLALQGPLPARGFPSYPPRDLAAQLLFPTPPTPAPTPTTPTSATATTLPTTRP